MSGVDLRRDGGAPGAEGDARSTGRDALIVALDLPRDEALALARELAGTVRWLKVGMTLFYREGPAVVTELRELGFDVFLDLKLHDIPHQVEGAAESVAGLGAGMLTVHASGGAEMIAAAKRGVERGARAAGVSPPAVLAVTVLTSMDDATLAELGVSRPSATQVPHLAAMAVGAGADGIVCSALEAASVRSACGPDALIVTPGIRPAGAATGDQSRVCTPHDAMTAGATHLVVGRPITGADDRTTAAADIIDEIDGGIA